MMTQIVEFFKGLTDTDRWPPRWHCGYWSDFHGWLYIISDLMIWLSYFLIPVIIVDYFYKKRKTIRFHKVYFLFAAFILLCGMTHFLDAVMFWVPMYRLNALVRLITAIVSLLTAYYLIKILPNAFRQRTSGELENEILRRIEAERKLEEANKSLNNFAYMAAHDLQEPLRKVLMYADRLKSAQSMADAIQPQKFIEKIIHGSQRMQQMTTGLLSLAVLNETASMQIIRIEDAIAIAVDDLEFKIKEKRVILSVQPLPMITGNIQYIAQLFYNLLGNAIKFSSAVPIITITGETIGNLVLIYITDNGIGIAAEDADRIFEPFNRLNSKSQYEGSGLGLAICKKIIDLHDGAIRVTGEKGMGSTFILEFPAPAGERPLQTIHASDQI